MHHSSSPGQRQPSPHGTPRDWPVTAEALLARQWELALAEPPEWHWNGPETVVGGVFVCYGRGGAGPGQPGDPAWAGAASWQTGRVLDVTTATALAPAAYEPGLLALREGPALAAAVSLLRIPPEVLLVDATGRDHPRRAGLALQLGAVLGIPTVGVTHRTLAANCPAEPGPDRGDAVAVVLDGETVGYRVRTKAGTLPLVAHAAWRTTPETARDVVLFATRAHRTPEPLRAARQAARLAREAGAAAYR